MQFLEPMGAWALLALAAVLAFYLLKRQYEAVSYTHLDVYKRQAKVSIASARIRANNFFILCTSFFLVRKNHSIA